VVTVNISKCVKCEKFPCKDVKHEKYTVPSIEISPRNVSIIMISEAAPDNPLDYYYADDEPLFARTTVQAFRDAGAEVSSIEDILGLGVYLTTAVKCGKTGYGIKADTVKECSFLLEKELALFPDVKAFMLMGDVAIKAVNYIAHRTGEDRVIPAGSTYKIRGREYFFWGRRAFPSYLLAGPSFFIEKSKRRMIAEDIASALRIAGKT
jgi:uracil-DNA glycosylase